MIFKRDPQWTNKDIIIMMNPTDEVVRTIFNILIHFE